MRCLVGYVPGEPGWWEDTVGGRRGLGEFGCRPASAGNSSYCGNYTYDGEKLVTRIDAASDPSRIGRDQVRGVRFEGERMVLIPPPRRTGEIEEHREITWERIAAE